MIKNAMSLKAKINNIAKSENISPHSVMQTYMLERLLERISKSKYKDNFILKGGMLISSIVGIDSRSTMDMDTTIKGFKLDIDNLRNILDDIISIEIDDNVKFEVLSIENIREDDDYGGLRVHINAIFDNMPIDLKIDVTTGDKITYKEINYKYNLLLENRAIEIWSYNLETIIAEKYESIIKRSTLNTRVRDFYDVYMLIHLDRNNISNKMLKDAIIETSKHRATFEMVNNKEIVEEVISSLKNDDSMIKQWEKYQKTYEYAKDINYIDLIESVNMVKEIYFK
jgi:predicted nucleotidyltransferase component of viral defense system